MIADTTPSAAREAVYLPFLFLTVAFLGGVRIFERVALVPPSLFSLILGLLLVAVLVRSGAVAPEKLMNGSRKPIENINGVVVFVALFAACAQTFTLTNADAGLPHLLFGVFFFVLLLNTVAASPDRVRVLRSVAVMFGSAFILKFIVLAALSNPEGGRLRRVLLVLLEGVTLGTLSQPLAHPATGYLAFFTLLLFLIGLACLPFREEGRRNPLALGFHPGDEIAVREHGVGAFLKRRVITLLVGISGFVGGRQIAQVPEHGLHIAGSRRNFVLQHLVQPHDHLR